MDFNQSEFWNIILNGMQFTHYIAYLVLMIIGAIIHFTIDVERSVRKDSFTPTKFFLKFMIWDNIFRIIGVILFIAVLIPYFELFMGSPITSQLALSFGLVIDVVIGRILGGTKQLPPIKRQRERFISRLK